MFTVSFANNPEQLQQALQAMHRAFPECSGVGGWRGIAKRCIDISLTWIPTLLVIVPLTLVLSAAQTIRGWHVVYLVVTAFFWGCIAVFAKRESDIRPLLHSILGINEPVVVRITETGIEHECSSTICTTPWRAFSRVVLTEQFLFLLKRGGHSAACIPVSAFENQTKLDEFASYASAQVERSA